VTTRTLVLLRHAKAETPSAIPDRDRPLTTRGHADAAAAGAWLAQRSCAPQVVICSPARRTRQTWLDVEPALGGHPEVRFDDEVYAASVDTLLDRVRELADTVVTVLLVGHNPAVSQLSALLDPAGEAAGLRTAGLAVHAFDGSWSDWGADSAPLVASRTARA
jgi:phosphohistidine phosphatase